jgi:hypothetical protein
VYLNIGLFSEEWLLHFNALVGGKPISPIEITVARKNSAYWLATEAQTPSMALFFLRTTTPHRLKDAPGGAGYLTKDPTVLRRGKIVFAERCARCHSSKTPEPMVGIDNGGCAGSGYLACWNRYWEWTKTDEYKQKMRDIVLADSFLDGNYLSNELRVPATLLETNACSPLATNAIAGNIWDNFSSQSYKDLRRSGRSRCTIRSLVSPGLIRCRRAVGATHAPPRWSASGRRRRSSRTTRWEVRVEPLGRGAHAVLPGLDREAALAGAAAQGPGAG